MLLSFSVKNFMSFKKEAMIDFHAAKIDEYSGINTFNDSKEGEILKGAYIFGPNSAGKSNFLNGITYMKYIVLNSFARDNLFENLNSKRKMYFIFNDKYENLPIEFNCEFKTDKYYYKYSFSILRNKIYHERLERKSSRYSLIFDRNSNMNITGANKFVSRINKFRNNIRDNALIVSVMTALNDEEFKDVYDWFNNMIVIRGDRNQSKNFNVDELKPYLKYLKFADKTIVEVSSSSKKINQEEAKEIMKIVGEKDINVILNRFSRVENNTAHYVYNDKKEKVRTEEIPLNRYSSQGTVSFMSLLLPIFRALNTGSLICIDEVDAKIHVSLVNYLVGLFNSLDNNPKNAQIIATTHDVFLLDENIRRDQIILVDKDIFGESRIYSLVDVKDVKKRDNLLKKYLLGYYGAIPCLKDIDFGDE